MWYRTSAPPPYHRRQFFVCWHILVCFYLLTASPVGLLPNRAISTSPLALPARFLSECVVCLTMPYISAITYRAPAYRSGLRCASFISMKTYKVMRANGATPRPDFLILHLLYIASSVSPCLRLVSLPHHGRHPNDIRSTPPGWNGRCWSLRNSDCSSLCIYQTLPF